MLQSLRPWTGCSMRPPIIALQVSGIHHSPAAAVDDLFPIGDIGIRTDGHPKPDTLEHFSQLDNGRTIVDRFVIDTNGIGADLFLQDPGDRIQRAPCLCSRYNPRLRRTAIDPIADEVIGIGRLVVPPSFQQDLDTPDRTAVLPERPDPFCPAFAAGEYPLVDNGMVRIITRINVPVRTNIKAGQHQRRKPRMADQVKTGIIAGIQAPPKQDQVAAGSTPPVLAKKGKRSYSKQEYQQGRQRHNNYLSHIANSKSSIISAYASTRQINCKKSHISLPVHLSSIHTSGPRANNCPLANSCNNK